MAKLRSATSTQDPNMAGAMGNRACLLEKNNDRS